MRTHITPEQLTVERPSPGTASIDVSFDGQRVWSIDLRAQPRKRKLRIPIPSALRPFLIGRSVLTISDSSTGATLFDDEVVLTDDPSRVRVVSASGRPLSLNKWGQLGASIKDMGEEMQQRIVERSATIVDQLRDIGVAPFIVGGTLLGAVRTGAPLPHDDDADIAYLSEYTRPVDVALEGFRIGHALEALGYELRRHSAAHKQLLFRDVDGFIDHYIDVFAAFFTPDGHINQPFHVRGPMRREQMLPFGTVELGGRSFPAPADVDRWLTINYDENWRTPIPGFTLETPMTTRRRFENWFGGYNLHREFWEAFWDTSAGHWHAGRGWLLSELIGREESNEIGPVETGPILLPGEDARPSHRSSVIELGCGTGEFTSALAQHYEHVLGVDFVHPSDAAELPAGAERVHGNLYRLSVLSLPSRLPANTPFDIVANHVFEQLGHQGRETAWRLYRMALRSGGNALLTVHTLPADDVHFDDPTGWHLDPQALVDEAARYGLSIERVPFADALAIRGEIGVRVRLTGKETP